MHTAEVVSLPCQPRVLALLMRELLSDVPDLRRVDQLFSADPVLAALLLESANSSAFQMVDQVRGIPQAIVLLGTRQLRALVKKAQTTLAAKVGAGVDMALFVRTSHATARLARSLCGMVGLEASAVYLAALLHALGQLIVHQTQPERAAPLNQEMGIWDPRRARLELRHWGYSACSITAALLRQSNLPADIVAAIEAMEAPLATEPLDPMAGVLHLAAWRHRSQCSGWSERVMADTFPMDVALALGVDMDVVLQQDATDWRQSMY